MIEGYRKKHQNNECLAIAMVYRVSKRFLKTTQNLPMKFGYFHFSVCSSTFLTAFWLPLFVLAEPNHTILSTDRSEPRFESHTGGKITKTLKNKEISTVFVNFHLNQIQNCSIQIKKIKDQIFSFQFEKKYFCQTFTDNARLKNVPPPLDLTRILNSYHKRNDRRKFPEKQERPIPREINRAA